MWVEGTNDEKPKKEEIIKHVKSKGYKLNNLEMWFDNMQGFWRFDADLVEIIFKDKIGGNMRKRLITVGDVQDVLELEKEDNWEQLNFYNEKIKEHFNDIDNYDGILVEDDDIAFFISLYEVDLTVNEVIDLCRGYMNEEDHLKELYDTEYRKEMERKEIQEGKDLSSVNEIIVTDLIYAGMQYTNKDLSFIADVEHNNYESVIDMILKYIPAEHLNIFKQEALMVIGDQF